MAAPNARQHPLFDHPDAQVRYGFWSRAPFLEVDEASALWLNLDPKVVKAATLAPYSFEPLANDFEDRRTLINRALITKDLLQPIRPHDFSIWCDLINYPLPTLLRDAIAALPRPLPTRNTAMEALQRLERLERTPQSLGTTARNSMLTMIGSMALDKYGYKAGAKRQEATAKIASATERIGIPLHTDTILKYLTEANDHISENKGNSTDSD